MNVFLFVLFIVSVIWFIFENVGWVFDGFSFRWIISLITLIIFGSSFIQNVSETRAAQKIEDEKEEAAWVAQGCPVYKSECGSKHRYACERKAAVVGRNKVGDIFVEAVPLCGK